jgi:pantoate--beta-alanine ligase
VIESVTVIGRGRVGSAVAARLAERGVELLDDGADVVLLCVPDGAIPEVARGLTPGQAWIGHVSGATPLAALAPHTRRFSLHPLQTFTRSRGPEQLDGAFAAVTGETPDAVAVATELARTLGLEPFELADDSRALYHAGAAVASNYLVTLYRIAAGLLEEAGAPDDRERVRAHGADRPRRLGHGRRASRRDPRRAPRGGAGLPGAGGGDQAVKTVRTIAELEAALEPVRSTRVGLVPTMGAFHDGHLALLRAAREECDTVVVSVFVNPAQFAVGEDFARYPRDEARDTRLAEEAGADIVFAPAADELYPPDYETWIDVEHLGAILEGVHRPGHFRGVATVCCKLFNLVRPQRAYFGQKDAQQAAVVKRMVRDLNVGVEIRVLPTVRDADGLALSSRNAYLSPEERRAAGALPKALATRDPERARELLNGLEIDYLEVADLEPRVLAAAVRVGKTRLIDNVVLEGDPA